MNVFAVSATADKKSDSVLEFIGDTPMIELDKLKPSGARVFAKLELFNPSGSIKDRMVAYAIEQAEKRGELKRGDTIVEASSGNTGTALAMVAAVKGYKAVIVLPDTTSKIKIKMMEAFGAELVFTSAKEGMSVPVKKAKAIAKKRKAFLLNQFENPDNVKSHLITGREILRRVERVDAFVAGIGTGGTLIGVAKVLKKRDRKTRIVAVEPAAVPSFYNIFYGKRLRVAEGVAHKIEGIGEGFVPKIVSENKGLIDDVILVKDKDALATVERLAKKEGVFAGPSSGANVWAALELAKKMGDGNNVVTVLPDTGQRYILKGGK